MSRMSEQHVKVSIVPGGVPPRIYCKRYDTGLSSLKLHVYDANNEPYTIENDTVVSFKGQRRINNGLSYLLMYDCSFDGNIVSVTVPLQLTLEPGEINCELRFVDAVGNSKGSVAIVLEVEDAVPEYGAIISGSDIVYANEVLTALQQQYAYNEMINRSPFKFKGTVAKVANLPVSGNTINDTYYVTEANYSMSWNGSAWSRSSFNEAVYTQRLTSLESDVSRKVNKPVLRVNGTAGQVLRTNGDGTTDWVNSPGAPSDDQVTAAVSDWLDLHPEALKEYNYDDETYTFIM